MRTIVLLAALAATIAAARPKTAPPRPVPTEQRPPVIKGVPLAPEPIIRRGEMYFCQADGGVRCFRRDGGSYP